MRSILLSACFFSLWLTAVSLNAGNKYWDINGATAGAGGATPSGNWDATSTNWSTDATGATTTSTFATGDIAIFSAGTDATGIFTISVPSGLTAGGITVEEGTVQKASGSAAVTIGTGTITVNPGAKFSFDGSTTITASSGANISLNGSTMENRATGNAGSFVSGNMTITVGASGGVLSFPTVNILNIVQTGTPGTIISGTGGITKVGAGVLAISTACTYAGPTIVNEGELRIRNTSNRLPIGTAVTVNSPGIFNLNSVVVSPGGQQIGSLSGDGAVGLGGSLLIISNATSTTYSGVIQGIANAGAAGFSGTAHGSVTKAGTGVLTLSGVNTYQGTFTLSGGGVTVSSGGALCAAICDVVVNSGTLTLNNTTQTIENLTGSGGTVSLGSGHTLTINPIANITYSGVVAGVGGLNKTASGNTLTLSGANTYSGLTTVSAGKLITTTTSTGGGAFSVAANATNGVKVASAGASLKAGGQTLADQSRIEFDLARLAIPTLPVITNTGSLSATGTVSLDVKNFDAAGSIPLIGYAGARTGGGSFAVGTVPPRVTASILDDTVNRRVSLSISLADSVTWISDANGVWDVNNSTNAIWKLTTGATPTYYQENPAQGDTVRFDDNATGLTTVAVPGTVTPYNVTIDNSSLSYTFSGAGKISGAGSITKNGTGTATINTTNDFTGGTTINAGTLVAGAVLALSSGPATVNAGTLQLANVAVTAPNLTLNNGSSLVGTGAGAKFTKSNFPVIGNGTTATLSATGASDVLEIASAIRNGNSSSLLRVNGAGTVLISSGATASTAYAGSWRLVSGTLRLSDINALGNPNNTSAQRPIELAGGTLETRVTAGGPFTTNTTVTGNAAIFANIGTAGAGTTDTFGTLNIGSSQLDIGTGANVTSGTMGVNFTATTLSGNATLNVTNGVTASTQVSPGPIGETGGPRSLTKTGSGTLLLAATNTYTGNTTNAGGKILITGTLSNSAVFVTGGTLGGTGTLASAMLVQSGGTLAPGMSIGTLTCNNSVTLQGNTLMEVNRTNSPNADNLVVNGSLTLGGTLSVTNIGSPFADGDTFALFNATSTSGAFAVTNLPAIGAGTNWWTTNNFATLTFNVWPNAASSNFVRTAGLGLRFRLLDLLTGAIAGKTIAVQSLSPGSQGASITFDGTYIRYIPANDNNDSFTYTINDGRGGTPTGTINVTVVNQSGSAQSISVADGAATIDCAGIPGYPYLLQRSTNLADWVTILTTNAPTNGLFNFTDTFSDLVTPPPSAYYRVAQP